MQDKQEQIRAIAYQLWRSEGEPAGLDVTHWRRAEEIWADENDPEAQVSLEPFGEPVEEALAVDNQGVPPALDDQVERTVAPRRAKRK